jgi:hypothetical protein
MPAVRQRTLSAEQWPSAERLKVRPAQAQPGAAGVCNRSALFGDLTVVAASGSESSAGSLRKSRRRFFACVVPSVSAKLQRRKMPFDSVMAPAFSSVP